MDANIYKEILEKHILPFAKKKIPTGWIFQQDNGHKHRSSIVQKWFKAKKVNVLPLSSQFSDLNPIENLWDDLERRVKGIRARNSDEKFAILPRELYKTDQCTIDLLMASVPNRCEEVIKTRDFLLAIELILLFYQLLLS
ncbi:hypothetical protein WR25_06021 [Diploscapter pachys]|uniref:Tc1-like transposase DDE domain-containing protein n=1 Tax=Diploscapter pachys TaxID=2018661 RepID=A0A2A2LR63_9BILA|nr:hypothetical protein WR25_06021 [Diploscapter pachys]